MERGFGLRYSEAIGYIHSLYKFGSMPGLERVTQLLEVVGNPHNSLKFIHVAGTNGKGSVCAMAAKIFESAGYKVGLYTSPFVLSFRERIQINGKFISKRALASLTKKLLNTGIVVTEFEFITAMAFMYFKSQKCDIVVLETGLGGRLDATNVIKAPLVSVITSISLDHTAVLGNTVEQITAEKCGIIKQGCKVVSSAQCEQAMSVIKQKAPDVIVPYGYKTLRSDFDGQKFIYNNEEFATSLLGEHQIENAVTAIEAVKASGMKVSKQDITRGLQNVLHPARMEIIRKEPLIILDGAHNPSGAKALEKLVKGKNLCAIVGVMADKDYNKVLECTAPYFENIVTVTIKENPRSLSAQELAKAVRQYNNNVYAAASYDEAIGLVKDKPCVVYGSLYLASAIRPLLFDI